MWVKKGARIIILLGCLLTICSWAPSVASADVSLFWEPSAQQFWTINHGAIMGLFQNGQCTQLAADKRPDVVKQIVEGFIGADIAHRHVEAVPSFDARYWANDAAAVGIPTGHKPTVGALIVFQPNVLGAGSVGHIAYVTSVGRQSFTISEMNAPLPYHTSSRTLPMSAARMSGVNFVYWSGYVLSHGHRRHHHRRRGARRSRR